MEKTWLKQYPAGVPAEIDVEQYGSLVALLDDSFRKYAGRMAYKFMGRSISFAQVDEASRALAAYLQAQGLAKGDRVALMMPNVPQYAVAVAAVLRAGLVVVNVNPLYTPRELEHQLKDSGARLIIVVDNFASTLQQVLAAVPTRKIVTTALGDMLGFPKAMIVNYIVRKVKKLVPAYDAAGRGAIQRCARRGRRKAFRPAGVGPDDIAVLQYTGGTTGVSKGAVLLHRNLVANILQSRSLVPAGAEEDPGGSADRDDLRAADLSHLRLHHQPDADDPHGWRERPDRNPRDLTSVFKELRGETLPQPAGRQHAVQRDGEPPRLQHGRLERPGDLGRRRHGGAERHRQAVAREDRLPDRRRLRPVETSPSVTCNPVDSTAYSGSIGLPLPNTEMRAARRRRATRCRRARRARSRSGARR